MLSNSYAENAINLTGLPVSSLWSAGWGRNPLLPKHTVGHEGVCDGHYATLLLLQTPSQINRPRERRRGHIGRLLRLRYQLPTGGRLTKLLEYETGSERG